MISARTKAAFAATKARGVKLGNPNLQPGSCWAARTARQARTDVAIAHATDVLPYIDAARQASCTSSGPVGGGRPVVKGCDVDGWPLGQ